MTQLSPDQLHKKAWDALTTIPDEWSPEAAKQLVLAIDQLCLFLSTHLPKQHPARVNLNRVMKRRAKDIANANWTNIDLTPTRKQEFQILRMQLAMFKDGIDARLAR